jgi:hypothetical protein
VATTEDRDGSAVETARVGPVADDGIVVTPAGAGIPEGPRRARLLVVGGVIVAILVLVCGIAVAARNTGSGTQVRTTAPSIFPSKPLVSKRVAPARSKPTVHRAKPAATVAATVPSAPHTALTAPPASVAAPATPRISVSVTDPPTTSAPPKQYGPSVLTWTAPRSFALPAGTSKLLPITAHNPTDGTVTLPHPLSCAPRLDRSEMCPEMVQLIAAGESASATYTIEARGVAKGHYTLSIEGVLTIAVTVS